MKIIVKQEKLKQALKNANKSISRKPHLPILNNILFLVDSASNKLTLTSTDLLGGIKVTCPIKADSDISFTLPGKFFSTIINALEKEETSLSIQDQDMQIVNGKDKINLTLEAIDDFPDFPLLDGSKEDLKAELIHKVVTDVSFACSEDLSRPILTGIYVSFGNELKLVGTDGFKLSILTTKNPTSWQEKSFILSSKAFQDVDSLVSDYNNKKVSLIIDEEKGQVNFVSNDFVYFAKIIDGNYPPYEKIIPLEFVTEVLFNKEEMEKCLHKALIFTRESSNIVKLEISPEAITISGKTLSGSDYDGQISVDKFTGEGTTISFNAHYLLDFLDSVDGDTIWLGINDRTKPAMLRSESDSEIQYIAMPFKAK